MNKRRQSCLTAHNTLAEFVAIRCGDGCEFEWLSGEIGKLDQFIVDESLLVTKEVTLCSTMQWCRDGRDVCFSSMIPGFLEAASGPLMEVEYFTR